MNRFKTFTLLLGVLLIASTTSCTKEKTGVYSPKKKIQRVYHSSPNTEKYLEQVWKWGDKTLESIDYYSSNGYFGWTENFTYKENRLDRIDVYVDKEYAIFTYNDNSLKSINYYRENNLSTTNDLSRWESHKNGTDRLWLQIQWTSQFVEFNVRTRSV